MFDEGPRETVDERGAACRPGLLLCPEAAASKKIGVGSGQPLTQGCIGTPAERVKSRHVEQLARRAEDDPRNNSFLTPAANGPSITFFAIARLSAMNVLLA
jgi:hypothetical protein